MDSSRSITGTDFRATETRLQGPRTGHAAAVQDSARIRPQTFAKSAGFALREANFKYKGKIIMGLEAIRTYAKYHPKAQAAFDALWDQVPRPCDPTEEVP